MFDDYDLPIIGAVNQYAGHSQVLDMFITRVMPSASASLLPLLLVLCWFWFSDARAHARSRQVAALAGEHAARKLVPGGGAAAPRQAAVEAILGAILALVVSRIIQDVSPYHPRPIHAGIGFVLPLGTEADVLKDWSSFPSDHAAMAFAMAAGVWRRSRWMGLLAFLWSAVMVCFPRLYAGWHYPSDLAGGALIGLFCTSLMIRLSAVCRWALGSAETLEQKFRPAFYTLALFAAFQVATMFDDIRVPARAIPKVIAILRGEAPDKLSGD